MYSRVKVLETLKRVDSNDPKILNEMAEIILSAKEKVKESWHE